MVSATNRLNNPISVDPRYQYAADRDWIEIPRSVTYQQQKAIKTHFQYNIQTFLTWIRPILISRRIKRWKVRAVLVLYTYQQSFAKKYCRKKYESKRIPSRMKSKRRCKWFKSCNFYQFETQIKFMPSNATIRLKSTIDTGYLCHRDLMFTSSDTHPVVEILNWDDFYSDCYTILILDRCIAIQIIPNFGYWPV